MKTKIILWVVGILILGLICAAPTLLSTEWGNAFLLNRISARVDGHATAKEIHLSWLGSQSATDLEIVDGIYVIKAQTIVTRTPLISLLFAPKRFGITHIVSPTLKIGKKEPEEEKAPKQEKSSSASAKKETTYPTFQKLLVEDGNIEVWLDSLDPVTMSEINLEYSRSSHSLHMRAQTEQTDTKGSVAIDGSLLENPILDVEVTNFPTALLAMGELPVVEAVGQFFNVDLHLDEGSQVVGVVSSEHVQGQLQGKIKDKALHLVPETELTLTITPQLFHKIFDDADEWELGGPARITLQVQEATIPIDFCKATLDASVNLTRAEIAHKTLGNFSLNDFSTSLIYDKEWHGTLEGIIQSTQKAQVAGSFHITQKGKFLYEISSENFPVLLLSLFADEADYLPTLIGHSVTIQAKGSCSSGVCSTKLKLFNETLDLSGTFKGLLTDQMQFDLAGTLASSGRRAELVGPTIDIALSGTIQMTEESFGIPLLTGSLQNPFYSLEFRGKVAAPFSYENLQLSASGQVKAFPPAQDLPHVRINRSSLFVQVDGQKDRISFSTDIKATLEGQESSTLAISGEVADFIDEEELNFAQARYSLVVNLQKTPTSLFDPFFSDNANLSALFGPWINLSAKGDYTLGEKPDGKLQLKASSQGFSTQLALVVSDGVHISTKEPVEIQWEMTPSRYHALLRLAMPEHSPVFVLSQSVPISLHLEQVTCPAITSTRLAQSLCQAGLKGKLEIGRMEFLNPYTSEKLVIEDTAGTLEAVNFSSEIQLKIVGNILPENLPEEINSQFSFSGKVMEMWTPEGKWNRKKMTLAGQLDVSQLPVRQLTGLIPMDPKDRRKVQAVLGDYVNARMEGQITAMQGPITIDVSASNFKAILPLQLYPEYIGLRSQVAAEITLTEEVSENFLRDITPLVITGAYSDHPISLVVDPDGFALPLHPLSFQHMQVGAARVDLGKIEIRNGGNVQALMDFLQATEITPDGLMEAWFTPIYVSVSDGVATYKRFDVLLAKTVHIALWGKINLVNDQVNMVLGISPRNIGRRFKIKGLSGKDFFQIKMRGTTNNLDLDWSAATTRIGILVASNVGGQIGSLVGGLIESVVKALGDNPTPPPTTQPFPWTGS